jgi:hypothetical protein
VIIAFATLGGIAVGWFSCFAVWHHQVTRDYEQQKKHFDEIDRLLRQR